uniref:Putative conserved plasma membrane protein rhodnius neglectus n=1 Tax=Rhodnius prolixus TaxID=13249 RepID=A0A4P6DA24_RHOPR
MSSDSKKIPEEITDNRGLSDSLKSASPILIKFVELLIGILCTCLIFVPFDNQLHRSVHRSGVVCVAFSIPIISNIILLTSHFRNSPTPKITLYYFSFVSAVFLIAAGCILINDWWVFLRSLHFLPPKMFMDLMLSSGIFSFVLSLF